MRHRGVRATPAGVGFPWYEFRAYERGARIVSICSGTFALADAGLLDGRTATTHWRHAKVFRRRFPRVRLNPGVLYATDGGILTGTGSAAGLDLCLHLVRPDYGSAVANSVARRLVIPQVGAAVGFANPATFRHHFARVVGTAPSAYRRTFRR